MFRIMTKKRIGVLVLAILPAAAGALVAANLATGGRMFLRAKYALASRLARHCTVVDLKVPGVRDLKMFLNPKCQVFTYGIMPTGVWEPNETHWVSKCVREGDTFVDLGANVGYYTLLASRLVGERGRVFAFEPDPTAFAILQKNVRLNGLRNVVLEQKAVSNENGSIRLFLAKENKGDHRIYQTEQQRPAIDVQAVTLDDYFKDYEQGIDFIKIDTQGAEGLILEGMPELIRKNEQLAMAVEFWPCALDDLGCKPQQFLEQLRSYDFLFFDLGPGILGAREIRDVQTDALLTRFTVENEGFNKDAFTNLLLVRGYAEMRRLRWEALGRRQILETDTPDIEAARRRWEDILLARIEQDPHGTPALSADVLTALRTPRQQRTARQIETLAAHFQTVSPLLAEARSELQQARTEAQAFLQTVLTRGGTVRR